MPMSEAGDRMIVMEKIAPTRIQHPYPTQCAPEERPYDRAAVEGVMKTVLALAATAGVVWAFFMVYTVTVWALAV